MSTNKTQNYALHSWLPTDDFQLSEVNQNFTAIDAALWTLTEVTGSYVGDSAPTGQTIELGFRPKAVLVLSNTYQLKHEISPIGLALEDVPMQVYLYITDTGFHVNGSMNDTDGANQTIGPHAPYRYLAWR